MYAAGASRTRKRPSAADRTSIGRARLPSTRMRSEATSGRGAQPGCGGTLSTGQVGPETTRPAIPEALTPPVAAAAAHSPARSTAMINADRTLRGYCRHDPGVPPGVGSTRRSGRRRGPSRRSAPGDHPDGRWDRQDPDRRAGTDDHILRIALDGLRYRPGAWARRVGPASARRFGPASAAVTKNVEWSRPRGEQLTFDAI